MQGHFSCIRLCNPMDWNLPQAPLSMGFSRQEYWSELPCPPPKDLPDPGIEPEAFMSRELAGRVLQHQCHLGSPDEWIKKMWYIYTTQYYSTIKKNEIMPYAATQMDLKSVILSQSGERQIQNDITYTWNLKEITQMNYLQNRNRFTDI